MQDLQDIGFVPVLVPYIIGFWEISVQVPGFAKKKVNRVSQSAMLRNIRYKN